MQRPKFFAIDLETHKIQPGLLAPPIVIGSFAEEGGGRGLLKPGDLADMLLAYSRTDAIVAGANIAYDFGCLVNEYPTLLPVVWSLYEQGRVHDVLIAATLNAIADGRLTEGELWRKNGSKVQSGRYSLEECVLEWLGRADAKGNDRWRTSYALLQHLPVEQWPADARQYPVDDAWNTLEVALAQVKAPALNLHNMPAQTHAALCLHLGSMWGLRANGKSVAKLEAEVVKQQDRLLKMAIEYGLVRKETLSRDMTEIQRRVSEAYHGNPPLTPTGKPATDRDTLEDSGNELLMEWASYSKWEKIRTYLPSMYEAARVPLNVRPNAVLATGRSSYEGIIQLIPQEGGLRECFEARPGHLFCSTDYAAIEMSTFAQACLWTVGWSNLADEINKGRDPHSILGADLLGITYDSFRAKLEEYKGIRQAAKAGNFGYPGMMGPVKFVIAKLKAGQSVCEWLHHDGHCGAVKERVEYQEKGKTVVKFLCTRCIEVSTHIREKYLNRWAEVKPYWQWVTAEIENPDARLTQFVSKRIRGGLSAPAAANTLFQGLAADGAKRAVVQLTKEMYLDRDSPLYGSRLVVFSHDETILEMPEEKAHSAALRQAEVMVKCMSEVVPDVRVKAEPALMRKWYKKAEAVYFNGKLIPWEPK